MKQDIKIIKAVTLEKLNDKVDEFLKNSQGKWELLHDSISVYKTYFYTILKFRGK